MKLYIFFDRLRRLRDRAERGDDASDDDEDEDDDDLVVSTTTAFHSGVFWVFKMIYCGLNLLALYFCWGFLVHRFDIFASFIASSLPKKQEASKLNEEKWFLFHIMFILYKW